jgi:hypothetical protein
MTSALAKGAKAIVDRGGKRQRHAAFGDGAGAGGGAESGVAAARCHRSPKQRPQTACRLCNASLYFTHLSNARAFGESA